MTVKLRHPTENKHYVEFMCPGCGHTHQIKVKVPDIPKSGFEWEWNGSFDIPTFTPSVFIKTGHYCSGGPAEKDCAMCNRAKLRGRKSMCGICHSFVTGGKIRFLGDCTHHLAGQTVDLPELI